MKLYKKKVMVTKDFLLKATDPIQRINKRVSLGAPSPAEVKRMVKEHGAEAKKQRADLEKKKKAVEDAIANLHATAAKLAK
jgi:hypothetical protein